MKLRAESERLVRKLVKQMEMERKVSILKIFRKYGKKVLREYIVC